MSGNIGLRRAGLALAVLLWLGFSPALADSTLVLNEIMYHPPLGLGELEWVELYNQLAVDMDVSGWQLAGGIDFAFPEGTVVRGRGFVVVAASPQALEKTSGFAGALGPFAGRLDDGGERLEIWNNNSRVMDSVRFDDEGDWPVGPDGAGVSLAKIDPDTASAPAGNWAMSPRVGGSPGEHNFPSPDFPRSLPAGLVSYWNFDEPSGRALDSADSNHATLGTASTRVPGIIGSGALFFDNTSSALVNAGAGTGNNFSTTTGITIEALIKPLWSGAVSDHDEIFRKEDGQNRILLSFQNDGNSNGFSQPAVDPGPVLSFGLNVGGGYQELDMPLDGRDGRPTLASLKDGQAHHVVATYSSSTGLKAISIDGALVFSFNLPAGSLISSGGGSGAHIGNMNSRAEPFTGTIDEVAFWNRALSAGEVAAHFERFQAGQNYFGASEDLRELPPFYLNEVSPTSTSEAWLEMVNHGPAALQLEGFVLQRARAGATAERLLGPQTLPPGGFLTLNRPELGFDLAPGDRLFLYTPDRTAVLDAARVAEGNRAKHPQATGRWLVPDRPTPGEANSFSFQDQVIINEIMYHHRPVFETPAVINETVLVPIDATWKYEQSGKDLEATWPEVGYDDSSWPSGRALLFNEPAALPAPKGTPLALGPITYYFRIEFQFAGDPAAARLSIRHVIDDGALFYLNGEEVHRFNLPAGAVTPSTLAAPGVGDAALSEPFPISTRSLVTGLNVLAVEVHQGSLSSTDVVFGAILLEPVTVSEAVPFGESPEAWIELYHRGSRAVDLTDWSLGGGIEYRFPDGTSLAPGEYLVVAGDRDFLQALHPGIRIAGNFQRRLSHRGDRIVLLDPSGNPADEVHYHDGGRWPEYADGGGSSLELRDPRADNSRAEAWAPSDEGSKTRWQTFTYRGTATPNVGPAQWNEFVLGLLDAGEVLLDDLSVIDSPAGAATQLLPNQDFKSEAARWRLLGNHGHSEVIEDPEVPGNHVLHLVATGPTEHMHNHAETTLLGGRIVNGRDYQVSFRARWLGGSNQLNTRLYFNRLPRTTLLEVPVRNGTPGARNSMVEANIGPTYDGFGHRPVVPATREEVTVSVRAEDPDGVSSCTLWWSVNGGAWSSAPMAREGSLYRAVIPAQAAATLVQFYVEGRDGQGAASTIPAEGPRARALYRVNDGQAALGKLHNFRILMTTADANLLHQETNVMSNQRLGATVVYDERKAFYDVGVRLKGSERGRPVAGRVGFNVKFHPDHLFRGVHEIVHVDRSGGWAFGGPSGQDEILIKHMINRAGGIPGMYDDLIRVIAPRPAQTGSALLLMARFGDVYLDSQFQDGSQGTAYKLELIYYPTTTTNGRPESLKRPQPDDVIGTDLRDLGEDKEAYRWNFLIENNRDRDDYRPLINLCKAFGLPDGRLEAGTRAVMDLEVWMRTFAMYSLTGINDTYTQGNNHNNIYYVRPEDQKVLVFPWDMDFSFTRPTNSPLWGDQNLARIINLPTNRRLFYCHLRDLIETVCNPTYMSYWIGHYGGLVGQNYQSLLNYINQRRTFVLANLPARVPFAITTNNGQDLEVNEASVLLDGTAWIDVKLVLVPGREEPLELSWSSPTRFRTRVDLDPGVNRLDLLAFDLHGDLVGSDSIQVTSTFGWPAPVIRSIVPAEAMPAESVTIGGTGFQPGIKVFFDSAPSAAVTFDPAVRPDSLLATVPFLPPGRVQVTVRNVDGRASGPVDFTVQPALLFVRGDLSLDGLVDLSDAVRLLFHLFGGVPAACLDAGDLDNNEILELTDVLLLLDYLFRSGPPPAPPHPGPGLDPRGEDPLDCAQGLQNLGTAP